MLRSFLGRITRTRRMLRDLDRIASAQEAQTALLQRLADQLCGPEIAELPEETLREVSGVSYSRDAEQVRIAEFAFRTLRDTGRSPTEDEVVEYLEGIPV